MKLSLRIVPVLLVIAALAGAPLLSSAATETVPPVGVAVNPPPVVSVGVSIDCSSAASGTAPEGTVASITASSGDCVSKCTGVGGTAKFNGSGKASTTLNIDCKGGPSDLAGCQFTAFWQDKNGNIVKKTARLAIRGHTYTLSFSC